MLLCTAAFPGFFLALSCFRRRAAAGAKEFGVFVAACSVYALGYAGELWAGRLEAMLLWSRVEYLGIAMIPTAWLAFVTSYTGHRLPPAATAALSILSAATFVIVLTMHLHGLYYVGPRLDLSGSFPTLAFDKGPWYWFFVIYIWLSLLFGEILLLRFFFKMRSVFKVQTGIAFFGAFLPFVANTVYLLGLVPDHIDPTPLTMPVFALPLAVSLLRFHFLDMMPVARERIFEAISDGVVVVDAGGRVLDANPAATSLLGIDPESIGRPLAEAGAADYGLSRLVSSSDTIEFSVEAPGPEEGDGGPRQLRARACPVAGAGGELGTVILVTDVTESKRLVARLDELASRDALTGLHNRRRFFESAQREFDLALRTGRPVAVCLVDLDHFKDVNDRLGHAMGDAVLREAAARFAACLRGTDLVCRYGGEEFAALFPECGGAEAAQAAERLRAGLSSSPIRCGDTVTGVTASLGVFSGVPAAGQDLDLFLKKADEALYRAKRGGRDRVISSE